MRMDEGPTSQGPKVQMWDACPRSKLAVCAGQSSRDKQAWHLPGERDHAVHTSIHWRPIIHTRGPSGEVGPTVSTSIYWGITRGGGAHCLRFHLLGNFQGRRGTLSILHLLWNLEGKRWATVYSIYSGTSRGSGPHCLHLHLLENLQGKWTHCLHFCLLGNHQQRGPLSTLPSTGEPPGEVGPTVYTSCYWGNSRGSGPHCLHLYWGTSRGSGFHCLHLHLLGKLQGRRSQLSTPLPTGEPPGEERDHCLHFHPLGNLQGRRGPLSTPPSTGEPPGEEGPTVYTSVYWGTSRGEVGHTVYTSIYWETGR